MGNALQTQDQGSLDQCIWVAEQRGRLLRHVICQYGDWAEAEDTVQEVLAAACEHPLPADEEGRWQWLVLRAAGVASRLWRRQARRVAGVGHPRSWEGPAMFATDGDVQLGDTVADRAPTPEQVVADRALGEEVQRAMRRLDRRDRRLLVLGSSEERQVAAARRRGLSRHQLRRRIEAARGRLLDLLEPATVERLKGPRRPPGGEP